MSKRMRSSKRVTYANSNQRLLSADEIISSVERGWNMWSSLDPNRKQFRDYIPEWDDARRFNPDPDPPARLRSGTPARFSVAVTPFHTVHGRSAIARSYYTNMPRGVQVPVGIKFSNPLSVTACIRRKIRREVMFAKGRTRKGAGARRHKRNAYSNVRC